METTRTSRHLSKPSDAWSTDRLDSNPLRVCEVILAGGRDGRKERMFPIGRRLRLLLLIKHTLQHQHPVARQPLTPPIDAEW